MARDLDAGVVHLLHDRGAEIGVGLEFDDVVDVAVDEAFGVGERGRAVEMVVGDDQLDAGGLGVLDDALLDLRAEADAAVEVGEGDHVVFRRCCGGDCLHRVDDHRGERVAGRLFAGISGRREAVEILGRRDGGQRRQSGAGQKHTDSGQAHGHSSLGCRPLNWSGQFNLLRHLSARLGFAKRDIVHPRFKDGAPRHDCARGTAAAFFKPSWVGPKKIYQPK